MALRASTLAAALVALLAVPAAAHATAPWPWVCEAPKYLLPVEGQPHSLDASCSVDPDGHGIVRYEWDLDGDGVFETDRGTSPLLTHTWNDRGAFVDATIHAGLRVTDAAGESAVATGRLRLTDQINSWFRFEPQLVNPGDQVTLEAYTSHVDADDEPAPVLTFTYAWDLDGDGSYETSTGHVPSATTVAPATLGKRAIGLRVTDNLGNVSTLRREVEVLPRHPSRDQLPSDVPANLGDTATLRVQEDLVRETITPVGPNMPAVEPGPQAPQPAPPRPITIRRISGSRSGLKLVLNGPRSKRYRIVVRLPADRAAGYGLPRRTVVFARGYMRFDGRGIGRARMRWTKGAYKVFRSVRYSLVDIVSTPA